ncbi:DNA pilot protein [Microvirus mar1]|uniref:DNA pilot protein n=1 Tax=Microvirus mar1 TaxID=2851141 RepID=A0A8F5MIV5_9VIRU|nr:DNA pilot protein [Microvirus mar1]
MISIMPPFDPYIGASLIGGVSSLLGGLFSSGSAREAQEAANRTNLQIARETNAANRALAEYAYSKDLEMWNRQNTYNSPLNQMQRLEAAGLNPNLVYGNGVTGNTVGSIPRYQAPKMEAPAVKSTGGINFGDFGVNSALSTYLSLAQIENVEQNTNTSSEQQANIAAKTEAQKIDNAREVIKLDIDEKTKQAIIEGIFADTEAKKAEAIAIPQRQHNDNLRTINAIQSQYETQRHNVVQEFYEGQKTDLAQADLAIRLSMAEDTLLNNLTNRALTQAQVNKVIQETLNASITGNTEQIKNNLWRLGISPNDSKIWRILGTLYYDTQKY